MARTDEIEALRTAAELVDGIASAIADEQYDRLPTPDELHSFAEHCRLLALAADDATLMGELSDGEEE